MLVTTFLSWLIVQILKQKMDQENRTRAAGQPIEVRTLLYFFMSCILSIVFKGHNATSHFFILRKNLTWLKKYRDEQNRQVAWRLMISTPQIRPYLVAVHTITKSHWTIGRFLWLTFSHFIWIASFLLPKESGSYN